MDFLRLLGITVPVRVCCDMNAVCRAGISDRRHCIVGFCYLLTVWLAEALPQIRGALALCCLLHWVVRSETAPTPIAQEPMKTLQPHELQYCLEVVKAGTHLVCCGVGD